ncbi:hypothetical protein DLJ57_04255 [Micromonospora chalcea]|nr:hypothetical protein A8711_08705 [Micromonospora sp. II]RQX58242.1 hypothetical protein DLJ57_04255 [Micromonospora chalcea]
MILGLIVAMAAGNSWRWWLTAGGVALVVLPLGQGAPMVAVVAAICGPIVVGAWAWGTRSGGAVGVAVGVVFIAGLAAVFAVSQWPGSLVAAPWLDWFAVWLLVGVGCLAALVIDRRLHAVSTSHLDGRSRTAGEVQWVAAMATLVTVVALCGCGLGVVVFDGDGRLRFPTREDEVLPLPASLRLVSADRCADGGSSGNCTAEFVVTAADGADRTTTVARLVEHLRSRGWLLQAENGVCRGSRETGGILNWTAHKMWLDADVEPASALRPAQPSDAVVIYIDNL